MRRAATLVVMVIGVGAVIASSDPGWEIKSDQVRSSLTLSPSEPNRVVLVRLQASHHAELSVWATPRGVGTEPDGELLQDGGLDAGAPNTVLSMELSIEDQQQRLVLGGEQKWVGLGCPDEPCDGEFLLQFRGASLPADGVIIDYWAEGITNGAGSEPKDAFVTVSLDE